MIITFLLSIAAVCSCVCEFIFIVLLSVVYTRLDIVQLLCTVSSDRWRPR